MFNYRNHISRGTAIGMVSSTVVGPISHKSPSTVSNLNNGAIIGTPLQLGSSDRNPISRQIMFRTIQSPSEMEKQRNIVLSQENIKHENYIPPMDSSSRINMLKGGMGVERNVINSTKNYTPNTAKSSLRRCRSSGCVAPRKKAFS